MKGKHAILIQNSSCRDSIVSNSNSTAPMQARTIRNLIDTMRDRGGGQFQFPASIDVLGDPELPGGIGQPMSK
jgi:hypothetical protein